MSELDNPYAPPRAPTPGRRRPRSSGGGIFRAQVVLWHAVLLNPLLGVILAVINCRRLKDTSSLLRTVLLYGLPAAAGQGFMFAAHGRQKVLVLAFDVLLSVLLYRDHAQVVREYFEAGGRAARWYRVTLVMLLVLLVVLAVWQFLSPTPGR